MRIVGEHKAKTYFRRLIGSQNFNKISFQHQTGKCPTMQVPSHFNSFPFSRLIVFDNFKNSCSLHRAWEIFSPKSHDPLLLLSTFVILCRYLWKCYAHSCPQLPYSFSFLELAPSLLSRSREPRIREISGESSSITCTRVMTRHTRLRYVFNAHLIETPHEFSIRHFAVLEWLWATR